MAGTPADARRQSRRTAEAMAVYATAAAGNLRIVVNGSVPATAVNSR